MAKHGEPVSVTMTLSGRKDEVMELVGLAVASGVLSGLQVRNGTNGDTPEGHVEPDSVLTGAAYREGDRVTQIGYSALLGLEKDKRGQHGTVRSVIPSGKGYRITVRWDDDTEGPVYARMIQRHRRSAQ